ncbi:hypothetical protein AA103196_0028 [Ameyamaea chiangmaiensis NBRC 103196]|uniref:Chemotaxis protein CheX n=1 Tax=Ameyamaea chiangmaiensis TaxID=442969 RepID=A0A850PBR6_9PROT|nr:STAS domain-containing protein [Ameyamaea chiangmaiensis]MBS4076013.1 anti-sigma factor antagonist [Ameyamaea chiangmaiensis]NVN40119.1 chemotaxis protein CheX [Ameyamaea chiangmaiensis]GBQ61457.1 hypothetical protein AA103196_0028 [Ameyamaea chiangmaiensis NBRC 103196]
MTAPLPLPERLDSDAAPLLLRMVTSCDKGDINLDGQAVRHLGGLCLQVLLALFQDRTARGYTFAISTPSHALRSTLAIFDATHLLKIADV